MPCALVPKFELYFHDRELGWTRVETRSRDDFDRFPDVYFTDPRVKLADMSGDGLHDIVYVNSGSVDYWPYLGHGRWGRWARLLTTPRISFRPTRRGDRTKRKKSYA